ncbi:MAG TPA: hypothetical protein VJ724_00045 [Tahibacter sp.]|nr:hypothetical protein [Tahibacter sp.]
MDSNDVCFDFVLLTERPGARIARMPENDLSPAERTVGAVLDLMAGVDGTLIFEPQRFLDVARHRPPAWWATCFEAADRVGAVRFRQRLGLALKIAGVHDVADIELRALRIGALSERHIKLIEHVLFCLDNPEASLYERLADYVHRNIDEIPDAVGLFSDAPKS